MAFQSIAFIVTPDELNAALKAFTLFIGNAHVPIDYICTPTEVFINNYTMLYDKLCSGEKIDYHKNHELFKYFNMTTDIESIIFGKEHLYEGKKYKSFIKSTRGYAPYFSPFTFNVYEENNKIIVSTQGSWIVDYPDIMGFQLYYPKLNKTEANQLNISSEKDWESYADFKLFKDYIFKHTSPLHFLMNGIEKKTQIHVSFEALKSLENFYCVRSRNIKILP